MTLNELGVLFLKQAEEKGWGHTKDMLKVDEKLILIHAEISELVEALHKKPLRPKDSIESETADILGRTLHLGMAWDVDFDSEPNYKSKFKNLESKTTVSESDFLYFHSLVSKAYDNYRHKRITVYKRFLFRIAHEVVRLTKLMNIDVEAAALAKMEINKSRSWDKSRLNGTYYSGGQK